MKFPDGFRAQYYLKELLESKEKIESQLLSLRATWPKIDVMSISQSICEQLAHQVDQVVLPTIVYEIASSRGLKGKTPKQRYQDFFLENKNWTSRARSLPTRFSFLFDMVETLVESSTNNVIRLLRKLGNDYTELRSSLLYGDKSHLTDLFVGISDRHLEGQQTAILSFSSGRKLVYKPVDLGPNKLFSEFINLLGLEKPFDLVAPNILLRDGYGWIEYVYPHQCRNHNEVREYYKRAGALLAIADSLNYCDGHMENLIASGRHPVLIDTETLFHVFGEVGSDLGERSVLFTGLIEKPPKGESDKGFTAAFQALSTGRYELLYPHAINDHTDKISVRYRGVANIQTNNSPVFCDVIQTPLGYIEDFVAGFEYGYNRISKKTNEWLNNRIWWEKLKNVKARQLIRHTLYYELLIRKMQQPKCCECAESAQNIVYKLLHSEDQKLKVVIEYELAEILKLDIPFFYHFPGSCDLYDGKGKCYPNYFGHSAMEEMREQAKSRSTKYLRRNIEVIRNVLPASPKSTRQK